MRRLFSGCPWSYAQRYSQAGSRTHTMAMYPRISRSLVFSYSNGLLTRGAWCHDGVRAVAPPRSSPSSGNSVDTRPEGVSRRG